MPDVFDLIHAPRGVPFFFERENRQQQIDVAVDGVRAIRTPRPHLRAHVVNHPKAAPMQPARQAQIELRPINENYRIGPACDCSSLQVAKCAPEFGKRRADFPQAENRQLVRIHN